MLLVLFKYVIAGVNTKLMERAEVELDVGVVPVLPVPVLVPIPVVVELAAEVSVMVPEQSRLTVYVPDIWKFVSGDVEEDAAGRMLPAPSNVTTARNVTG